MSIEIRVNGHVLLAARAPVVGERLRAEGDGLTKEHLLVTSVASHGSRPHVTGSLACPSFSNDNNWRRGFSVPCTLKPN